MPSEDCLVAAGGVVHAGKMGRLYDHVGQISVSQAAIPGVDANLWVCLQQAVDALRLAINIDAVDAGTHGPVMGCRARRAVAINRVGAVHKKWHAATVRNPQAVRLVEYFLAQGFRVEEAEEQAMLRFGPAGTVWNPSALPHTHHLSLSLPPPHRVSSAGGWTEGPGEGLAAAIALRVGAPAAYPAG